MSALKLSIGARIYDVSGFFPSDQEAYVRTLALELNRRVNQTIVQLNTRDADFAVMMTALFMLDDLQNAQAQVQSLSQNEPQNAPQNAQDTSYKATAELISPTADNDASNILPSTPQEASGEGENEFIIKRYNEAELEEAILRVITVLRQKVLDKLHGDLPELF